MPTLQPIKQYITITACEAPKVRHAQPGKWWHYQVTTPSGRNQCSGYTPGARADAERVAMRHLTHMQSLEGSHASNLITLETQRVAKHSRVHSEATPWRQWSSHTRDPARHDELCRCRTCALKREKQRFHKSMSMGDVKRRQRKRKARA